MTVTTTNRYAVLATNGATTVFPYSFKVLDANHISVILRNATTKETEKTYTPSEYVLSGVGSNAGSVTITPAPATGKEIVITRTVPYKQNLDIVNQGGFYPDEVENELDLIVMQIQQNQEEVNRAIKVAIGETGLTVPGASSRANKFLGFDGSGNVALSALSITTSDGDTVDSRLAMAALTGTSAGDLAILTTEDGGLFRFDDSDLTSEVTLDTEAGIFIPPASDATGASGSWVRIYNGVVNAKWFGATGDGSTDDTDALIAALDFADAYDSKVLLPYGTFVFSGGTVSDSIRMFGPGIITLTGNLNPAAACTAIELDGITINASKGVGIFHDAAGSVIPKVSITNIKWTGGTGIKLRAGADDVLLQGCEFNDLDTATNSIAALMVGAGSYADAEASSYIRIIGNKVNGVSNDSSAETHAFLIYGADVVIEGNTINDVYHSAVTACEAIYTQSKRVSVTGNTLRNCGPSNDGCITVKGSDRGTSSAPNGFDCTISGNTIVYNANNTTQVIGIRCGIANVSITGNVLYNCYIAVTGDAQGVNVTGNNTYIVADGYAPFAFLQEASQVTWASNKFEVVSQNLNSSSISAARIRGNDTGLVFDFLNNTFKVDYQGVTTGGASQLVALDLWASAYDMTCRVKGNVFTLEGASVSDASRFAAISLTGANDIALELTNNTDNRRILKDNSSGSNTLTIKGNRSPVLAITTGNVTIPNDEFDARADNIGATGVRILGLPTTDVGARVEITASSRTYGITVSVSGLGAWEDGSTTARTLAASSRVVLVCHEAGYWLVEELAGTFS